MGERLLEKPRYDLQAKHLKYFFFKIILYVFYVFVEAVDTYMY